MTCANDGINYKIMSLNIDQLLSLWGYIDLLCKEAPNEYLAFLNYLYLNFIYESDMLRSSTEVDLYQYIICIYSCHDDVWLA